MMVRQNWNQRTARKGNKAGAEPGMYLNPEPHWWSWSDIVQRADQLGVPNFQRGAVWDTGNRTALLESLYEQSPCGSFVVWAPDDDRDPLRHGVPLRAFAQGVTPLWLVDGQQRTRAMLDTFQQLLTVPTGVQGWTLVREAELRSLRNLGDALLIDIVEEEENVGDNFEDAHFWGVVLPAMRAFDRAEDPYFGRHGESRNVLRGSMFRRLSPRARVRLNSRGRETSVPPLPLGVVPLATLLSPEGIFHDDQLRSVVELALGTFKTEKPDLEKLDDLIPWGPQFVTGHFYERPTFGEGLPTPIRWADLHARRDATASATVELLTGLFAPEWSAAFERFASMLDGNRFAVGWLPPGDVSGAIDAYVRINRAGIRVRPEERALALLSRAHPRLLDDLADFVRLRDGDGPVADQRSLLTHESDRQLGFGVWMTSVTRYSTLALLGTLGRRWLGTSAMDKDTFGYRLDRVGPNETPAGVRTWARPDYATPGELIQECSARASRALVLVDSVLSVELLLDHRMARPSARAVTPLIDLFYRLPESALDELNHDRAFRAAAARLLQWTLLAPYIDQPDLERLIVDGHGIVDGPEADGGFPLRLWGPDGAEWKQQLRRALGRYLSSLRDLWYRKHTGFAARQDREPVGIENLSVPAALTRLAVDAFAADVREARSLQHPAVGWLYAIERRGNAREFLWQAQIAGFDATAGKVGLPKPPGPPRYEAALSSADGKDAQGFYPEKQHIVPFSLARQIVGKGGTRATASPANAIGNLTWLSRRQNGLDALADRWTVMDRERDGENLAARGMLTKVSGQEDPRTTLAIYEELRDMVLEETWS
jgi:hypothetical protein